jgi:A/G-specific adenine glycosylase
LSARVVAFREAVLAHYAAAGRDFPWRRTADPWAVLLSEVMLQQTQTDRVVPYWRAWLEAWPRPADLAAAPLDAVLRAWSGLGYNSRAVRLREAARRIVIGHAGSVPAAVAELDALPGIGPYTARAVACFAFGAPEVFIETNIRAAALHWFFPEEERVADADLFPYLEAALDKNDPRRWNWALMDYGAALKRVTANPSRRSSGYSRQTTFEGSPRQARGAVVKVLAAGIPLSLAELAAGTGLSAARLAPALSSLAKEGIVAESSGRYSIAEPGTD